MLSAKILIFFTYTIYRAVYNFNWIKPRGSNFDARRHSGRYKNDVLFDLAQLQLNFYWKTLLLNYQRQRKKGKAP